MTVSSHSIRIGLLDSGVRHDAGTRHRIAASCAFTLSAHGDVSERPDTTDTRGHGSAIAAILLHGAPQAVIVNAQVFHQSQVSTPALIAAGLDWLLAQRVAIVNMSFGVRHDRTVLRSACDNALAAGVLLVAAAPARGPAVFPSAYPGVLRVTGDARCGLQEFSHLASRQADFGACPRAYDTLTGRAAAGGASFAAAHVSACLAVYLATGGKPEQAAAYLERIARYHGPERRSGVPS